MIPLLSRAEVRAIDKHAIERLGVPGVVLMENAGAQAAALLRVHFPGSLGKVVVLGGVGQNGGDGWVVARHLLCAGSAARCILVGERERVRGDAAINLAALEALGCSVECALSRSALEVALGEATLVVDALFGTGLDRALAGPYLELVELINRVRVPVVALDLPSGIDADTGQVLGAAVRAALTVTFAAHKPGLHQHPGVDHAGQVTCVGIGVPVQRFSAQGLIDASDVALLVPRRAADSHKGSNGHVLAIAGSAGKTGAAALAASSALRAGAGLVTVASDAETRRALDHKVLEVMTAELSADDPLGSALQLARGKAAVLVGPGLGTDEPAQQLARGLAQQLPQPCVLDADALTAVADDVSGLKRAAGPRVLTPHPGEAARLLGVGTVELQNDRLSSARALAALSGQVVVLKGARTIVASPLGELRICTRGTAALGTAGTGDVLAGAISALCAAGLWPFSAAVCAVELHARAGELAAQGSDRGLLAGELAAWFTRALEQCREESAGS